MPLLTAQITEPTEHILDPIMRQITHETINRIGLTDVFKDNVHIRTKYTSNSSTMTSDKNINLVTNKFVADATIQQIPTNTKWEITTFSHSPAYGVTTQVNRNTPLFYDEEFKVPLFEQGAPCSISMQCTMYIKDREIAYQMPTRLYNLFMTGSVYLVPDIMFDYPIPKDILYVLGVIYQRKKYTKQFHSFYEYLNFWSGGRISTNLNVDGTRPEMVLLKHQVEILTSIEYNDDEPGTENAGSSDTPSIYTIPFTLNIQFNLPNMLYLKYPILIENQLLPFESIALPPKILHHMKQSSYRDTGFQALYQYTKLLQRYAIHTPFYDDWEVPMESSTIKHKYMPFLISAQLIDEDSDVNTLDLKDDLGSDLMLPPLAITLLRQQEEVLKGSSFDKNAIINISVFYGNNELDKTSMDLSEDLVLTFKGRYINDVYRVVISEQMILKYLSKIQFTVLVKHLWNFDIYVMGQLWRNMRNGAYDFKIPPFWITEGWWRDPYTNCFYDQSTGKLIFCIGTDGSWTDGDGNKHYPEIIDKSKEKTDGGYITSRIWYTIIETWYAGRLEGYHGS